MRLTENDKRAMRALLQQHEDEDLTDYSLTDINGKWELLSAEELREAKQKCFNRNVKVKFV